MVKDHSTALFLTILLFPKCIKACLLVVLYITGLILIHAYKVISYMKEGRLQRGGRRRQERVCVREKERGGFEHVSLPGSLLGLHSLKLFFYKGPCLAERGVPARIKRKGWASPVKDATVAMWEEKYSSLLRWLLIQFSSRQESLMNE